MRKMSAPTMMQNGNDNGKKAGLPQIFVNEQNVASRCIPGFLPG